MTTATRRLATLAEVKKYPAVAIIDLGGQYCHMIGRRLRDLGIRAQVFPHTATVQQVESYSGIILSGGPRSVNDPLAPSIDGRILKLGVPVLGICYGHQLLARELRGRVSSGRGEYGKATLELTNENALFAGTERMQTVWMSHGDTVESLPSDFEVLAKTDTCRIAAFASTKRRIYGVQFHPEVIHSVSGQKILSNFASVICAITEKESIKDRVQGLLHEIQSQVGDKSVLFFVSGGVDSTVAFALCARALPKDRVLGIYVDTGLMRKDETEELRALLESAGLADRLEIRHEAPRFLSALDGVSDPEDKRRKIGRLFVEVQRAAMLDYGINPDNWLLGQGTIYPDTVESGGRGGDTAVIKTHHNRCAEIKQLIEQGRVIEPLTEFYKDEVRQVGAALGLSSDLVDRWPFPGPGLAIRVLCNNDERRNVASVNLLQQFSKYKAIHVPLKTVGVQGDYRTFRDVLAIRGPLDYSVLAKIGTTMCNSSRHYNRVIAYVAGKRADLSGAIVEQKPFHAARVSLLRDADDIVKRVMRREDLMARVWQFPTILIPLSFEGGETIVLRPVNSEDGMTANFGQLPLRVLKLIGEEIANLDGIDAVFLDVTDKPPATIEWE